MKTIKVLIVMAIVAIASVPAQAQFKFGPKLGLTVNELHFNSSTFNSDNRAGFTAGAMLEFTMPVAGWGFDASVMYVRRNTQWLENNNVTKDNRDYIDIPINLKWKINIPLINNIVRPYLATGPSFSFLTSRNRMPHAVNKCRHAPPPCVSSKAISGIRISCRRDGRNAPLRRWPRPFR